MTDKEKIGALQVSLDNALDEIEKLKAEITGLQAIAADLNRENVSLNQQVAHLLSDGKGFTGRTE